ncbi:hypothetical protein H8S95_06650 [Pontibacter sp. KCTC 32443]|uniref:hypothetical protein n=1 Tax=Pontibacter TaxID=323449 RepID=UPI00164D8F70|nr:MULTISPECIES: hypothetical protein [Pontibacter]MBC5773735.1 hypothetical protein [Pontibacter sp. KCTC 32443]
MIRLSTISMLFFAFCFYSCQNKEATNSAIGLDEASIEVEQLENNHIEESSLKEFSWQEGLCDYRGYYNSSEFTEKQIEDTYFLIFGYNSVTTSDTDATLDKPEYYTVTYIENSLKKLESDYSKAIQKLQSLDVVPTAFWQQHRELSILQLKELHQLEKLTLEAHLNPKLLVNTTYSSECVDYVNALTSEDTTVLLDSWKKLVDSNKLKNGYPEGLEQKYQEQLKSSDKLLFARIDLMTYGWWNCANHQRKYVDGFNQEGQMTEEFDKLFDRVVESNCED